MERFESVDDYLDAKSEWRDELALLRQLLLSTELEETTKWAMPVYTLAGKNVVGMGAFKDHVGLWFFQGVFLKDNYDKLLNAQEGKTKAMRQMRFAKSDNLDRERELILEYILEAIENQKNGRELTPERQKAILDIPVEFQNELEKNSKIRNAFINLTPGKKRECMDYINEAKRQETRMKRKEKVIQLLMEGKTPMDQYRS